MMLRQVASGSCPNGRLKNRKDASQPFASVRPDFQPHLVKVFLSLVALGVSAVSSAAVPDAGFADPARMGTLRGGLAATLRLETTTPVLIDLGPDGTAGYPEVDAKPVRGRPKVRLSYGCYPAIPARTSPLHLVTPVTNVVLGTTYAYLSDGAKRDRLVWSGDLWWAQYNMYAAFASDSPYMPGSLRMLAENQTPEGYVQACPYPESHGPLKDGDYGPFASERAASSESVRSSRVLRALRSSRIPRRESTGPKASSRRRGARLRRAGGA